MTWGQGRRWMMVVVMGRIRAQAGCLVLGQQDGAQTSSRSPWLPWKLGSPALQVTWSKTSEFNCCQQAGIQWSSRRGEYSKSGDLQTTIMAGGGGGLLETFRSWQFPMHVHFPLPKSVIWMDFIWFCSLPPNLEFWKEGKAFSSWGLCFSLP